MTSLFEEEERYCLAARVDLSEKHQEMLATDSSEIVRETLARNPIVQERFLLMLVHDSLDVRLALAYNRRKRSKLQEALAGDLEVEVRCKLAQNPEISHDAEVILAGDPEITVQWDLLSNKFLSEEALLVLAAQRMAITRERVAERFGLPPSVQVVLSFDPSAVVRSALAERADLTWTEDMSARFVKMHNGDFYQETLSSTDPEVLHGIQEGWTGSLKALREACVLVCR